MDAWAARSHQRAIAAMDAGKFLDEIVPLKIEQPDGSVVDFSVDEHPRRDTTVEKLAGLKVLHPEIEGFSITAGTAAAPTTRPRRSHWSSATSPKPTSCR
jgi:acetyl-CoA acyltransferase